MKWIRTLAAVTALLGLSTSADAGLFSWGGKCGAEKKCGAKPTCQPRCCKPTIQRPCESKTHTFQRMISKLTPPCCKPSCCAPKKVSCCAPAAKKCAPACGPKANSCAAPAAKKCAPACAPKGADCAAPTKAACGSDAGCGPKGGCGPKCDDNASEIAELIYASQTACYAKDRAKAIDRLGDRYDCRCNPEIMSAFAYALNDCDERVRHEAADEIGDQVRKHGCCCMTDKIVEALTMALADCDKGVRHEAEEALEACGYEIVDNCKPACGTGCGPKCGSNGGCKPAGPASDPACHAPEAAPAAPAPMPEGGDAAPAPAPPEEKSAARPLKLRSRLANLFGLR